ncbi:winged helix-turn-helix domain-containing protein [Aurantiacibacter sediminis]|uniref:Winged helix-turn-helix domain-containing protein n=1 Tax=Aurantiacibacter sediminis TaxID=2793064 RepID=A0ABS0N2P6_9SPHN|nr:winged helix-turn-helix domain-containing protein [Aurantiacibacter sediminis]MBH5322246.1 winged helix-turn-helix domain-containing protein [Aurantiacibacter sediminis]
MNIEGTGSLSSPRIDLAHEQPFTLGPMLVEPALRKLTAGSDEETVEPKVMQVLVALGKKPGAILSRDDLIECCWDGRIVGDASINRVVSLLRTALRELTDEAVTIETLPKVGYRVLVASDAVEGSTSEQAPETASAPSSRRRSILALAGIAMAMMLGVAGWWWLSQPNSEQITIAMLPIEASEGVDPLYAAGMAAEIRSQLGSSVNLEVTAGESARQLVEQDRSAAEIGVALQVDYVWQGTLSNSADNVSLDARLVEAESGDLVWSESLQAAPDAAQFLPMRATRIMLEALDRPINPNVQEPNISSGDYALYLTAMGLLRSRGVEERLAAHEILEQLVDRNPDFGDGLAGLAKANYLYPTADRAEKDALWATALEQAEAALEIDPLSADALKVSGMLRTDDLQLQLERLQLATEIDPGDAEAWFWRGIIQRDAGPLAADMLEISSQLIAVDPLWPASWAASQSAIEFGDFALARELEERVIAASATEPQRLLARARLARIDGDFSEFMRLVREARGNLSDAERRWGFFTLERYTRFLLGLQPMDSGQVVPTDARTRLLDRIRENVAPTPSDFIAAGITDQTFWDDAHIASEALPLLLRDNRETELLVYYDTNFGSTADFAEWARETDRAHHIIPFVAPYMAMAMRRAGRDREASQLIDLAREWTQLWSDADQTSVFSLLYQLQFEAITGDSASAIETVHRLPDFGWPLQLSHTDNHAIGLLNDDPLFAEIRLLPEVRAVLDPIRAQLARERAEVLALGFE